MEIPKLTRFMGSLENMKKADIVLAGFPYDCTASFRSGSRFASREIRNYAYEAIEDFSFQLEKGLDEVQFFDVGDVEIMVGDPVKAVKKIQETAKAIIREGKKLLAIGGEHLVTYPLFLATQEVHGDFTLLQLDAHADLRSDYADDALSHASVMRLCLDHQLKRLVQVGVRSGTKEEFQLRKTDSRILALSNMEQLEQAISEDEKIYLTLDVDFFDPSQFPGTGTPEAGGASYRDFISILKILRDKKVNIIGADVVEFAPDLDLSKISTAFAAKVIRELLLVM